MKTPHVSEEMVIPLPESETSCTLCATTQITLVRGDDINSVTPIAGTISKDADGCNQMKVTCTVPAESTTIMTFQNDLDGPNPDGAQTISAQLTCEDGVWTFRDIKITEVNCALIPPPCPVCDIGTITLVEGDNLLTLTPTLSDVMTDANECLSVIATCDASEIPGANTTMTFQDEILGPNPNTPTINADITCSSTGKWEYEGTEVTEVNCKLVPPCATCLQTQVKELSTNPRAITIEPEFDDSGCLTMDVTCQDDNGGISHILHGENGEEITAVESGTPSKLICRDHKWRYSEDGTNTPIVGFECVSC